MNEQQTQATFDVARFRAGCDSPRDCNNPKRAEALAKGHSWPSCENCRAADEIERLRAENAELKRSAAPSAIGEDRYA